MKEDLFLLSKKELTKEDFAVLEKEAREIKKKLEESAKKAKISAEVFIGGSLAKMTLVKKEINDADIFVRFDKKYEDKNISTLLTIIINKANITGEKAKIHGSRDYFRIIRKDLIFEIVPVLKIKSPKEAKNVTDLSYFHVNYVKNKINRGIDPREIIKAKAFCKSAGVYGAESYIRGFSGYGLECMIIAYKSFNKMLKEIVNAKGKIILDPEKFYKSKDQILMELNENKLKSPIILIDPTWKERNVLAALSDESFMKLKERAKSFLKKPSPNFFEFKEKNSDEILKVAERKKGEFCEILVSTAKQEGDIAGAKMKKFYCALMRDIKKEFAILAEDFCYLKNREALIWVAALPQKELIKEGPEIIMSEHAKEFKKRHPETFLKKGRIYARVKPSKSIKKFIEQYRVRYKDKIAQMDISDITIKSDKIF